MKRNEIEPLSTREILKCAIQNEKIAFENYNAIGEIMLNSDNFSVAQIFFEAAKVEKGHFRKLQKALKRLYGIIVTDATPLPFSTGCPPGSGDNACLLNIRAGMRQEDATRFLEEAERAAEKYYRDAVEMTERPDMKILFRTLADEEGRHRRLIQRIARKAVTRDIVKAHDTMAPETVC